MRLLLISLLIFYPTCYYSQERLHGYIGVSQMANYRLKLPDKGFTDTESNLHFGLNLDLINASVSFFGSYAYGGVVNYTNFKAFHKNFSPYQLDYHLLGVGVRLRLRNKDKFYSPIMKASFLTEVYSNYRGKKLIGSVSDNKEVYFSPTDRIYENKNPKYGGSGGPLIFENYYSFNYISTPLVGSFFVGNELKLSSDLYLNIGIGYLFRVFRFYKNEWELNESEPEVDITDTHSLKENKYGKIETVGSLEFEVGLSYTFSFKPKPQ